MPWPRTEPRSAPVPTWQLLVEPLGRPGAENMALDRALLEAAARSGGAFLRLYRFNPPCVSFGRNEPARMRYDRDAMARLGLDAVRRPTGGRAVWHQHELTYAVAAPVAAFGSPRAGYRAIHERLAAALRALGAAATLAPDRCGPEQQRSEGAGPAHASGPCFAAPVGGEVLVAGRKVIGSAQVRHGPALLQHGSILLDGSQDVLATVCRTAHTVHTAGVTSTVRRATTLAAALGRQVEFDEVAGAIIAGWAATRPATARPPDHLTAAFCDPGWTWRR
jgi:lipoyl(octanoyl) transferase